MRRGLRVGGDALPLVRLMLAGGEEGRWWRVLALLLCCLGGGCRAAAGSPCGKLGAGCGKFACVVWCLAVEWRMGERALLDGVGFGVSN